MEFDPTRDYPLGRRRPDLVTTPSGLRQADVTLDALRAGTVDGDDVRATTETIKRQAAVALAAGRTPLAENLLRAAELAAVPADTVLDIYTALRPRRATAAELEAWAERLERELAAPRMATFVREALVVYAQRGLLAVHERSPAQV
ncbi:MAG: diol dehydratase small subunit [Candidatus Doudnabacteria bacterium]